MRRQTPTVTVTSDKTSCTEGDSIKFTATVTPTGFTGVDTYTFAWFDGMTDLVFSATDTTAPLSQTVTYKCATVSQHTISAKVTGPYTADTSAATTVAVIDYPLTSISLDATAAVGQLKTLTVVHTVRAAGDTHTLAVDWCVGAAASAPYQADVSGMPQGTVLAARKLATASTTTVSFTHIYGVDKVDTSCSVKVTLTDGAGKVYTLPSKSIAISKAVSA